MRFFNEKTALERLSDIRSRFAERIQHDFEHKAKDCSTCETKGACCLDAHFVNVRVTRLEAAAMRNAISELPRDLQKKVAARASAAIEKYNLRSAEDPETATYACPLFEPSIGCLVHSTAKPFPCIAHACYERREDLPPDELLDAIELEVASLDRRVYRLGGLKSSIPLAINT